MLIELLVICLVLLLVFYVLTRYVMPALPGKWGTIVIAVIAIIVVIFLLNRYLGLGL